MSSDTEDRVKLILSDGTKYIELEVDGDSAIKLRSDLSYAKRHMLAIAQMLPASVKLHEDGDNVDKSEHFLLVTEEEVPNDSDNADYEYVPSSETFIWTNKSASLLCKLRLEMEPQFQGGPRSHKINVWNRCAQSLRQAGFPGATGDGCRKKWHNMTMTYKRILETNSKGRSTWEHFNAVHSVIQQQAIQDPQPSLIITSLSEPRKRKRLSRVMDTEPVVEVIQNGDSMHVSNSSDEEETLYVHKPPHKSKPKSSNESVLKMFLNLRRDELQYRRQESDRRWEEKKEKRRDKLRYQEEKLKAIKGLSDILEKLLHK